MDQATTSQTLSGYWRQQPPEPLRAARVPRRQTKIVCTLGPASCTPEMVLALAEEGMDVARLNFSHGTHADHRQVADAVRVASATVGRPLAIMADLCGPKIRATGLDQPLEVETGGCVTIAGLGDNAPGELAISFAGLSAHLAEGDQVLIDDGLIRLRVAAVDGTRVVCDVESGGLIRPNKGVNLPGVDLPISALTAKDEADLEFALGLGVDAVALSFVRTADDVTDLRRRILVAGSDALIVAKIEKAEAVADLDAIVHASDVLMVARGDLGAEIGVSKVPLVQKQIIEAGRRCGKAVITATQMLESMIERPEPTRAEVSDVANAIIDGTSAVMLSAETASGNHPLAAVRAMSTIALEVEPTLDEQRPGDEESALPAVLARSACDIARRLDAALIAVPTDTGSTAREIARSRPRRPIVASCSDAGVLRRLVFEWGVMPIAVPPADTAERLWRSIVEAIRAGGLAAGGETIVFAGRTEVGLSADTTHVLVHRLAS